MSKEFKPPLRSVNLEKKAAGATQLPNVIKVGMLVLFETSMSITTGWVIQNSLSPGGQTASYLIVPWIFDPRGSGIRANEPKHGESVYTYQHPLRIDHSQVLAVLEPQLP